MVSILGDVFTDLLTNTAPPNEAATLSTFQEVLSFSAFSENRLESCTFSLIWMIFTFQLRFCWWTFMRCCVILDPHRSITLYIVFLESEAEWTVIRPPVGAAMKFKLQQGRTGIFLHKNPIYT